MDGAPAVSLDETDFALLSAVERDFDVSLETLANELGLSKSAVHYRLSKLKENGAISGVTADVDPHALGLSMVTITEVSVTHERGYAEEIGARLGQIGGVQQVFYTLGDVDFIVISRVASREQMNALLDDIVAVEGVDETSSHFVMKEIPVNPERLLNLSKTQATQLLSGDAND
ncbi:MULTISPECIES: Lrp/AsnC family transcriptional regulator [unclassified Haladaptatus]|uniref:Lrp/AsnC family transcriptional regulator n=1 Tax=unclassified Haladaptatus TaxID=2622732 RepID=UPI0023E76AEF|nr:MULTISPECIES: Lrp/AsnC family transcriptional regulator [unclassified Haladaptatus]